MQSIVKQAFAVAVISSLSLSLATDLVTAAEQQASIRADFQPVVDGQITVAEVTAPAKGFVAVWLPKDNKPFRGEAIGVVAVEPGKHVDLKVILTKPVKPGQTLGIALHQDTGKIGEFDFAIKTQTDPPFMNGRRPALEVIGVID